MAGMKERVPARRNRTPENGDRHEIVRIPSLQRSLRVLNLRATPLQTRPGARPKGQSFGRVGTLEVRLAAAPHEIAAAQRLRYRVFYEEMSASPSPAARERRRDADAYDAICDHLLVIDTPSGRRAKVVGTYRVLQATMARRHGVPLYTQSEYDIAPLLAARPDLEFMELGRSCVAAAYRNKRTLEVLWHGLWTYVRAHKVDVMIGCASFAGDDADLHAEPLSFLHHYRAAPPEWSVRAHPHLHVPMDRIARDAIDAKQVLRKLPPLIKGYLRLGAYVGDGAYLDRQFKTTDVCIVLPVEKIDPRYFAHFGAPDEAGSRIAD